MPRPVCEVHAISIPAASTTAIPDPIKWLESSIDALQTELVKERHFGKMQIAIDNDLLRDTGMFDKHPPWYTGACLCQFCCDWDGKGVSNE